MPNDLDTIADLVGAGERLNIRPHKGEDPGDFARRLAQEIERQPQRRLLPSAARVALAIALAAFGITSF